MNKQEISLYFLGITDIPKFMQNCGIPAHKEAEVTKILKEAAHDFFSVSVHDVPTAFEQKQLDNAVNNAANKLAKL